MIKLNNNFLLRHSWHNLSFKRKKNHKTGNTFMPKIHIWKVQQITVIIFWYERGQKCLHMHKENQILPYFGEKIWNKLNKYKINIYLNKTDRNTHHVQYKSAHRKKISNKTPSIRCTFIIIIITKKLSSFMHIFWNFCIFASLLEQIAHKRIMLKFFI